MHWLLQSILQVLPSTSTMGLQLLDITKDLYKVTSHKNFLPFVLPQDGTLLANQEFCKQALTTWRHMYKELKPVQS